MIWRVRRFRVNRQQQRSRSRRASCASLAAQTGHGQPETDCWLELSQNRRLEHEQTHIACRRLLGEMRINHDGIVADAMGMTRPFDSLCRGPENRSDCSTNSSGQDRQWTCCAELFVDR